VWQNTPVVRLLSLFSPFFSTLTPHNLSPRYLAVFKLRPSDSAINFRSNFRTQNPPQSEAFLVIKPRIFKAAVDRLPSASSSVVVNRVTRHLERKKK
jgi:hypothetical protein